MHDVDPESAFSAAHFMMGIGGAIAALVAGFLGTWRNRVKQEQAQAAIAKPIAEHHDEKMAELEARLDRQDDVLAHQDDVLDRVDRRLSRFLQKHHPKEVTDPRIPALTREERAKLENDPTPTSAPPIPPPRRR